jgi:hypothetical protein
LAIRVTNTLIGAAWGCAAYAIDALYAASAQRGLAIYIAVTSVGARFWWDAAYTVDALDAIATTWNHTIIMTAATLRTGDIWGRREIREKIWRRCIFKASTFDTFEFFATTRGDTTERIVAWIADIHTFCIIWRREIGLR